MIIEEKNIRVQKKINHFAKAHQISMLKQGEKIYTQARGMSMYPFIKNGDYLEIEPINPSEIKMGDIVAIDCQEKEGAWFVVHRVVGIKGNLQNIEFITKGDFHRTGAGESTAGKLIVGVVNKLQRGSLEISFRSATWGCINKIVAAVSLNHPDFLPHFARILSLIMEWRLLLRKAKNWAVKSNPLRYNSQELLLICAREVLDKVLKMQAKALIKQGLNWDTFCDQALRSGVASLTYNSLQEIASEIYVPNFVLERLRLNYLYIISKLAHRKDELSWLLSGFAKSNIQVIPLKGLLLAQRIYSDIAARDLSVDCDLLIKEEDKDKAVVALEDLGYRHNTEREIPQRQWCYTFLKDNYAPVELHWDITMMLRSEGRTQGIWQGCRQAQKEGLSFYEFNNEELLIYLSIHLINSSNIDQLRYVCDIHNLITKFRKSIVWGSLIAKARKWRAAYSLYASLCLSLKIYGTQVPEEALNQLKPGLFKRLLISSFINKKVLLRNNFRKKIIKNFLGYILLELVEASSFKEFCAILSRIFYPPKRTLKGRSRFIRAIKGPFKIMSRFFQQKVVD